MIIEALPHMLTVCKVSSLADINLCSDFFFVGKTDEEISVVCLAKDLPARTIEREDGWRAFRIQGQLDFSLVGVFSELADVLATRGISIFAVSTYDTDYILVREESFAAAAEAFAEAGYDVVRL